MVKQMENQNEATFICNFLEFKDQTTLKHTS